MATLHDLQEVLRGAFRPAESRPRDLHAVNLGRVVVDHRKVGPGDVYWALVEPRVDGTEYVDQAFARGAAGAVVARPVDTPCDRWTLVVDDTQQALEKWAAWNRARFQGTVIAVTGCVGKATSRQLIHAVLRKRLAGTASPRNFNNHVSLPLSLLALEPAHTYAVLELAASRASEITCLAKLCAPAIGVITSIGESALASFGSQQATAEAYEALLAALPPDGHAVLGEDAWLRRASRHCRAAITWVGHTPECDLAASDVRCGHGQLRFRVADCEFAVPVWGRQHLASALAAVAVGRLMGIALDEIATELREFEPLPRRCEVTELRGATIINDTYRSEPGSILSALELLRDFDAEGRRIVVCGDVAADPDDASRIHRQLGSDTVAVGGADLLIACGDFAREIVAGARAAGMTAIHSIPCRTPDEVLPFLGQAITPGDVVLVKGSRLVALGPLTQAMQNYPRRRAA